MRANVEMDVRAEMQKIAEYKAVEAFTEEYVAKTPLAERVPEALGIALAGWAGWDGTMILKVAAAALEDANYHSEAEILLHMAAGN